MLRTADFYRHPHHPSPLRHVDHLDSSDDGHLCAAVALQIPLFALALTFWVLMLAYITSAPSHPGTGPAPLPEPVARLTFFLRARLSAPILAPPP